MDALAPETESPQILPLTLDDLDSLRLGWWSRFDPAEVESVLRVAPGISTWIPDTHEYALVGPWRHRTDIVHVIELVSMRHPGPLTAASISLASAAGKRLFLAVEMTERRRSSFYDRIGLEVLEEVLSYELIQPSRQCFQGDGIERIASNNAELLEVLTDIDDDSFPWLWRNSREEFRDYLGHAGVEIHVLREEGAEIGYAGITAYHGWGHIDRVAVRADHQGRGLGRRLTQFAISRLAVLGASRIGLSTQRRNVRSQALYESMGFRRQIGSDYQIYGRPLVAGDSIDDLVMGLSR